MAKHELKARARVPLVFLQVRAPLTSLSVHTEVAQQGYGGWQWCVKKADICKNHSTLSLICSQKRTNLPMPIKDET